MRHSEETNNEQNVEESETQESSTATVVATSYVPESQYQRWQEEADKRNQSISTLISTMVQAGVNDIELQDESPNEIMELRKELSEIRREKETLQDRLNAQQRQEYEVGLGKIKELIINNPGITRREIVNEIMKSPVKFVDGFLNHLETSDFEKRDGEWYPPEELGDD